MWLCMYNRLRDIHFAFRISESYHRALAYQRAPPVYMLLSIKRIANTHGGSFSVFYTSSVVHDRIACDVFVGNFVIGHIYPDIGHTCPEILSHMS